MCRLYGFRANEPTKVECTLLHAQNALWIQSRSDRQGVSHADGWGIAHYARTLPTVERRALAAHQDLAFIHTAERVFAPTVVAHIRRATVGGISLENTHPFRVGRWLFAHNGTVTAFDKVRGRMDAETLAELGAVRGGSTDSEHVFSWLLSQMVREGVDLQKGPVDADSVAALLARSVERLALWSQQAGAETESKLNFLLTNGPLLLVSRWKNSLYCARRVGVRDCEICGIPHVEHRESESYLAVIVASEPISQEGWDAIPEAHILTVNENVETSLLAI